MVVINWIEYDYMKIKWSIATIRKAWKIAKQVNAKSTKEDQDPNISSFIQPNKWQWQWQQLYQQYPQEATN